MADEELDMTRYMELERQADYTACENQESFLALYRAIPSKCALQPHPPHLRQAAAAYRALQPPHPLVSTAEHATTLTIDYSHTEGLPANFLQGVLDLNATYARRLLLLRSSNIDFSSDPFVQHLIKNSIDFTPVFTSTEEEALIFSSYASNLLLHKGSLSALMGLTSTNKVYFTDDMHRLALFGEYRYAMPNAMLLPDNHHGLPAEYVYALRAFQPQPSCCRWHKYGDPSWEKKMVCSNVEGYAEDQCWVLSIGSQGNFVFEESVVNRTKCSVHVFDCTGDWTVPEALRNRVWLHKKCVSHRGDPREEYLSIAEMIEFSSKRLGLPEPTKPTLMKLDAEGYEYASMLELVTKDRHLMPDQMAVELHMILTHPAPPPMYVVPYNEQINNTVLDTTGALRFLGNMSVAGYELVNKLDNWFCPVSCAEFSFVRRDKLPPVA